MNNIDIFTPVMYAQQDTVVKKIISSCDSYLTLPGRKVALVFKEEGNDHSVCLIPGSSLSPSYVLNALKIMSYILTIGLAPLVAFCISSALKHNINYINKESEKTRDFQAVVNAYRSRGLKVQI